MSSHTATPIQQVPASPAKVPGVHRIFLFLVLVLTAIPAWKLFATLPRATVTIEQVLPAEARPGETVTVTGYALDAAHIQELYLIGDDDIAYPAGILFQSTTALRFRVPMKAPAGWMRIAVKAPDRAELKDQMAYLKVLEPAG